MLNVENGNYKNIVTVYATAVIESCPHEKFDYKTSIESIVFNEHHMRSNLSAVNIIHVSSRVFRSNLFTHTVNVVMSVKTSALWDSPRQYIWKYLGQDESTWKNGTRIKFSRINVK